LPTEVDLRRAGIKTVVWATGYRPDHSWIDLTVFDHKGGLRHDGGVVAGAPGLYALGLNVLRRRGSSFIAGAERDTAELAEDLQRYLDGQVANRPSARRRFTRVRSRGCATLRA
jgi:putative flavoprotein involved in K+ transport